MTNKPLITPFFSTSMALPWRRDKDWLKLAPPLHGGPVRLLDYTQSGRAGMGVKLQLLEIEPKAPHPFRGVPAGTSNGQRLCLTVCTDASPPEKKPIPVYSGEALLAWWSEDITGLHIRLQLDDSPDGVTSNPFQGLPVGAREGAILMMAAWAISDQDRIITPERRHMARYKEPRRFNSLSPVQQSQILCRTDPAFQAWCDDYAVTLEGCPPPPESGDPANRAADVVRHACKVSSRAELRDPEAAARWAQMLESYRNWLRR